MSPSGYFLSDAFGDLLAYVYGVLHALLVVTASFKSIGMVRVNVSVIQLYQLFFFSPLPPFKFK